VAEPLGKTTDPTLREAKSIVVPSLVNAYAGNISFARVQAFVRESHIDPIAHVLWSGFSLPESRVGDVDASSTRARDVELAAPR